MDNIKKLRTAYYVTKENSEHTCIRFLIFHFCVSCVWCQNKFRRWNCWIQQCLHWQR